MTSDCDDDVTVKSLFKSYSDYPILNHIVNFSVYLIFIIGLISVVIIRVAILCLYVADRLRGNQIINAIELSHLTYK